MCSKYAPTTETQASDVFTLQLGVSDAEHMKLMPTKSFVINHTVTTPPVCFFRPISSLGLEAVLKAAPEEELGLPLSYSPEQYLAVLLQLKTASDDFYAARTTQTKLGAVALKLSEIEQLVSNISRVKEYVPV